MAEENTNLTPLPQDPFLERLTPDFFQGVARGKRNAKQFDNEIAKNFANHEAGIAKDMFQFQNDIKKNPNAWRALQGQKSSVGNAIENFSELKDSLGNNNWLEDINAFWQKNIMGKQTDRSKVQTILGQVKGAISTVLSQNPELQRPQDLMNVTEKSNPEEIEAYLQWAQGVLNAYGGGKGGGSNSLKEEFIKESDEALKEEVGGGKGAGESLERFKAFRQGDRGTVEMRNRTRAAQWQYPRNQKNNQFNPRETAGFITAIDAKYGSQHELAREMTALSNAMTAGRNQALKNMTDEGIKFDITTPLEGLAQFFSESPAIKDHSEARKTLKNMLRLAPINKGDDPVTGTPINKLGEDSLEQVVDALLRGKDIGDLQADPEAYYEWLKKMRAYGEDVYGKQAKSHTTSNAQAQIMYKAFNQTLGKIRSQLDTNKFGKFYNDAINSPELANEVGRISSEGARDFVTSIDNVEDLNLGQMYTIKGIGLANATMDMDNSVFAQRIDALGRKLLNRASAEKGGIWKALGFINDLTGFSEIAADAMSAALAPVRDKVKTSLTNFLSNVIPAEKFSEDDQLSEPEQVSQMQDIQAQATQPIETIEEDEEEENTGGGHFLDNVLAQKTNNKLDHYMWK